MLIDTRVMNGRGFRAIFATSDRLSGGHFRNGKSAHRCWVQTLSHFSLINRLSETVASAATHRDLALAEKAIALVNS